MGALVLEQRAERPTPFSGLGEGRALTATMTVLADIRTPARGRERNSLASQNAGCLWDRDAVDPCWRSHDRAETVLSGANVAESTGPRSSIVSTRDHRCAYFVNT